MILTPTATQNIFDRFTYTALDLLPVKPFDKLTYDDAKKLFNPKPRARLNVTGSLNTPQARRSLSAISATLFFEGDHWQDSTGFMGQLPPPGFPDGETIKSHIKQRFDSENVIKEVVETHRDGVLGREPLWSFLREGQPKQKPTTKAQRTAEDVIGETLTPWWNERQALKNLQNATDICLCEGKAVIRLFFPRGRLPVDETGNAQPLTATDIPQALDFIYFETHTADVAGVFIDDETMQEIGVYLFDETNDEGTVTAHCAELSYLDKTGNTICRLVKQSGDSQEFGPYQLGGRLLLHEVSRSQLITEQVQANQKGLNFAKTMMLRNVNMAGARERTVSNSQPPGKPVKIQDPENPGKTKLTKQEAYVVGGGGVMFLMGYPIYDKDGHVVGYTNPTVDRADPAPVEVFIQTSKDEREAILSQCHQRHTLIAGDATASGLSRKTAEKGWQRSLKESKTVLDAAGRWKLETTLRLAAQLCNQTSKYINLRADFNCLLDVGDPDPEDIRIALEMRAPGGPNNQPVLSDESVRQKCGVEDPAAELARIEEEAPAKPLPDPNPPPQELGKQGDGAIA